MLLRLRRRRRRGRSGTEGGPLPHRYTSASTSHVTGSLLTTRGAENQNQDAAVPSVPSTAGVAGCFAVRCGELRPTAFIDWDLAASGARVHDVAHVGWQYLDLGPSVHDIKKVARRTQLIVDSYELPDRRHLVSTILWRRNGAGGASRPRPIWLAGVFRRLSPAGLDLVFCDEGYTFDVRPKAGTAEAELRELVAASG
ncbi:hypothetical protein ACTMUQ_13505 [Streptomyces sp. SD11]|uniref:hypothetical protein n=1 Tax=Streptomyces sp. SD11 TaxID=3452209 RepID=UPI003F8B5DA6